MFDRDFEREISRGFGDIAEYRELMDDDKFQFPGLLFSLLGFGLILGIVLSIFSFFKK